MIPYLVVIHMGIGEIAMISDTHILEGDELAAPSPHILEIGMLHTFVWKIQLQTLLPNGD